MMEPHTSDGGVAWSIIPVADTHLTLPTKRIVEISVVAVVLNKEDNMLGDRSFH